MKEIDDLDLSILRILQRDGTASYESISSEVGTSVGTVYNRIKRLKEDGIILRIVPEINTRELGFDIVALIDIRVVGGHIVDVQQEFSKHPNVVSVYDVTGEYDTIFVTKFRTTEELNKFVKILGGHEHVVRTNTKLALNVIKEGTAPQI